MTDAWLSMAGAGSVGKPNGVPVDEWGIRMEKGSCNPVGADVARGGAANGPAAVYAIRKWDEWLRAYAPQVLQQTSINLCRFIIRKRCSANFLVYSVHGINGCSKKCWKKTVDDNGNPLWRMGPSPKGPYWDEGMKLGYQDAGSWTLLSLLQ